MGDRSFKIGAREFQLSKLDAFKQFHIMRRIAPIMSELLPAMAQSKKTSAEDSSENEKLEEFAKMAQPIMTGLAKLSDEDAELVLYGLLNAVELKQAQGNWARIASGRLLMFQDLELPILFQCAGRALMFNLSGFFGGLPHQ